MTDNTATELPEQAPRMIDIHVHIVPGVDDGAGDLNMSMELMRLERAQGVCGIIATPHSSAFEWSPNKVRDNFAALAERAAEAWPDMPLALGCELHCYPGRMDEILERLAEGDYIAMNGTRWVLTEFSTHIWPDEARCCAEALIRAGWRPIIAHAERYSHLFEDGGRRPGMEVRPSLAISQLRGLGCLVQVNAYSIVEEPDPVIHGNALRLLAYDQVDFLGTDAHTTCHRPPNARSALLKLRAQLSAQRYAELTELNARRLLFEAGSRQRVE